MSEHERVAREIYEAMRRADDDEPWPTYDDNVKYAIDGNGNVYFNEANKAADAILSPALGEGKQEVSGHPRGDTTADAALEQSSTRGHDEVPGVDVAELRRLLAAAHPLPWVRSGVRLKWRTGGHDLDGHTIGPNDGKGWVVLVPYNERDHAADLATAELVARGLSALPALLALLDRDQAATPPSNARDHEERTAGVQSAPGMGNETDADPYDDGWYHDADMESR